MKIVYRHEALADIHSQMEYIAADSPVIAADVATRLFQSIKRLETFPYSGRKGSVVETYEMVVPRLPYIVVYRITEFVEILAVFHTAQERDTQDTEKRGR